MSDEIIYTFNDDGTLIKNFNCNGVFSECEISEMCPHKNECEFYDWD